MAYRDTWVDRADRWITRHRIDAILAGLAIGYVLCHVLWAVLH